MFALGSRLPQGPRAASDSLDADTPRLWRSDTIAGGSKVGGYLYIVYPGLAPGATLCHASGVSARWAKVGALAVYQLPPFCSV